MPRKTYILPELLNNNLTPVVKNRTFGAKYNWGYFDARRRLENLKREKLILQIITGACLLASAGMLLMVYLFLQ